MTIGKDADDDEPPRFQEMELNLDPEERLFTISSGDWRRNAVLAARWSNELAYAMSFKEAGDILVERGLERQLQDLVFFPALYCYRHALELSMKGVCYRWERANGRKVKVIDSHKLMMAWRKARRAIEATWPEGHPEQLDAVESIIKELDKVDPGGEQFRYDRARDGSVRELPEELMRVDLVHIREVMGKILYQLWGAEDGIDHMDPGQ